MESNKVLTGFAIALGLAAVGAFVMGAIQVIGDEGPVSSGPMAVSDGCCFGSLWIVASCGIGSLALFTQIAAIPTLTIEDPPVVITDDD